MTLIRHRLLTPGGQCKAREGGGNAGGEALPPQGAEVRRELQPQGTHTAHQGRHWGLEVDLRVS